MKRHLLILVVLLVGVPLYAKPLRCHVSGINPYERKVYVNCPHDTQTYKFDPKEILHAKKGKRVWLSHDHKLIRRSVEVQGGNPWPYGVPTLLIVDRMAAARALIRGSTETLLMAPVHDKLLVAHFPGGNLLNEIRNALGRTEGTAVRCPRTELEKNFAGNIFPANCPEALGR